MKAISTGTLLATLAISLLAASPIVADSIAITAPNAGANLGVPGDNFTVGYEFTVGAHNLSVTALGMWDESVSANTNTGLLGPAPVGIWDTTAGNPLVVATTVPSGTAGTLIGEYRYVSVTPVTLLAGHEYLAGAYVINNDYHASTFSLTLPTFATPDVNFDARALTAGNGAPTTLGGGSAWDAPNFQFIPAPEPGSLVLCAIGLLGLLLQRVFRRK